MLAPPCLPVACDDARPALFARKLRLRVAHEGFGFELIGAGLGHRRDRGARDLVVLGLVVRRDDLVLADGKLRKRVAGIAERVLARIGAALPRESARAHVVLLPDAVDVDVGRSRVEWPAADGRIALGVDLERHARDGVGELEEIASDLRRGFDLVQRDSGPDLRCLDLGQTRRTHRDLADRRGLCHRLACEIQCRGRGDGQRDALLRAGARIDLIGAGGQAHDHVGAVFAGLNAPRQAGVGILRSDLAAGGRVATQGCVRRLCRDLARQGDHQHDRGHEKHQAPTALGHSRHRRPSVHESSPDR